VKRRTVGWKKCAADDNHVETGVKKYFNIGEVTVRAPGKAEDVCPPPARRVKIMDTLGPQGSGRKLLAIFGLEIVAIVSNNVTFAGKNSPQQFHKKGDMKKYWRAFDQIQVFDQMLGGYF
jgi:hypothetical protein